MPSKNLIIQDIAIVADTQVLNPTGEARHNDVGTSENPLSVQERQDMVKRLNDGISTLMDDAQKSYNQNCFKPGTKEVDGSFITRLSTNEFFFYTLEPLTLGEFETLQNLLAEKAKAMSAGVQLVFGSFSVLTPTGTVMNVTPHITCGAEPDFNFVVKNYTSPIDVRYKVSDGQGGTNSFKPCDIEKNPPLPEITINGVVRPLTFNNIISSKTPEGMPFITAIDICLDHAYGVAKENLRSAIKENSKLINQPISHMVISNSIKLNAENCLTAAPMHVDPLNYKLGCKKNSAQEIKSSSVLLAFGNDSYTTVTVEKQALQKLMIVNNSYAYQAHESTKGREHGKHSVSLDTIDFKKSVYKNDFQSFKEKYQAFKGDHLKTQILEDIKSKIEMTANLAELQKLKTQVYNSYEHDVLKTGQGVLTKTLGLKTSSSKALEGMFAEKEEQLIHTGLAQP